MTEIPDPTAIGNWPAAFVAITIVLAVLVVPSVLSYLGNQRVKAVQTTLTEENGGGSVKDALNRIETTLADQSTELHDQGERLRAVEEAQREARRQL